MALRVNGRYKKQKTLKKRDRKVGCHKKEGKMKGEEKGPFLNAGKVAKVGPLGCSSLA